MTRTRDTKKQGKPATTAKDVRRARPRSGAAAIRKKQKDPAEEHGRYWMRCPRCGLGLIETVKGTITTERCTACGAVWADPKDVERLSDEESSRVFKILEK